ncbi:hypothetical protein K2Z84_25475 [Candidatus Binatia bacterium]|nr:hypothetical protein [Candidatus Binatia bacterium]
MSTPISKLCVVATAAVVVAWTGIAIAQQNTDQQKCLNAINKDGALVAKAQGKASVACVKDAGTGKLVGTADACLTADAKGKIAKAKGKTLSDETKSCGTAPSFGYPGGAATNTGAQQAELDLVADVFGASLDPAITSCTTSKAGCGCQQKVADDVTKLADTKLAEFLKCKKTVLKSGASSAAALEACVADGGTTGSITADSKGKIAKAIVKLTADIGKKCDTPGVTSGAFPGTCTGLTGSALAICLDRVVECRVCQAINDMDALAVNCDVFDDGSANGSCASGAGPTPVPSPSPSPSPSPTPAFPPGTILQGVLTPTTGRFNYNLVLGVAGADAACTARFPGTHACTYANLQAAEAAGDLDGAKDTNGTTVTSFWAIDASHANQLQCTTTVAWDYATAHTGHFGEKVNLNSAAGTLSALQSGSAAGVFCLNSSWVGCCL